MKLKEIGKIVLSLSLVGSCPKQRTLNTLVTLFMNTGGYVIIGEKHSWSKPRKSS